MEHVYEKIINLDTESQTTNSSTTEKPGEQEKEEDVAMLAEEKTELMCQDQVRTELRCITDHVQSVSSPVVGRTFQSVSAS